MDNRQRPNNKTIVRQAFGENKWRERTRALSIETMVTLHIDGWDEKLKLSIMTMPERTFTLAQTAEHRANVFTFGDRNTLIALRDFLNEASLEDVFKMKIVSREFNTVSENTDEKCASRRVQVTVVPDKVEPDNKRGGFLVWLRDVVMKGRGLYERR